jgi:hypothetical protein
VGLARAIPMWDPPRKWMRLTSSMVRGGDVVHVALHQPLEAVADAEHLDALEHSADGGGADHAVDAGGGAAAHQDGHLLRVMHGSTFRSPYRAVVRVTRSGPAGLARATAPAPGTFARGFKRNEYLCSLTPRSGTASRRLHRSRPWLRGWLHAPPVHSAHRQQPAANES